MISSIKIKWYKCYEDEEFMFSSWINLLVWENDSWKSTVLDAIRIFSWDKVIDDLDNHNNWLDPIEIIIEKDWLLFSCKKENWLDAKFYKNINLLEIREKFDNWMITNDEAKETLSVLWINQQWINLLPAKKVKFEEYIINNWIDLISNPIKEFEIPKNLITANFGNIKYEDGKRFQNIQENFKSFVKDSVNTIRSQQMPWWGSTIQVAIQNNLDAIKISKEADYRNNMLPTIQEIMPEVIDIKMTLNSSLWNFNWYEAQIDFINLSGNPISIDKKWDWTKRRVTLAMFKIESNTSNNNIYLLDEPDTHLNLRVQQDLITMFENLASSWHQVIFTTHSPFILNLMSINDITMINHNGNKSNKVDTNLTSPNDFELTLYNLWIQNIDIFFSKYFVFFEWDTEKEFFSRAYQKKIWTTIEKKFVRQVIADWIDNEAIFMANFQKIIWEKIQIICIVDSDYAENRKSKWIIDSMENKYTPLWCFQKFALGTKEFEDLFESPVIYSCFEEELGRKISLADFSNTLVKAGKKSEYISQMIWLWKPEIGKRLANYLDYEDLHIDLQAVINHIYSL